ncbi:MAG: sigma-70 family RNA polymerase sigma factor [Planctomycetes bacterium]|nr:sigma-70 family RNA polymerase sigma factor [Planctomycetota bacterium]HRV81735.1 sigma-70 family RNA polymerase sigma factor [Planctomycetota bacterium]
MAAFLERYRGLLYHCIGHFEADTPSREDLYQDLVLYVLERLDKGSFDPEKGSLGTWLYRVAWCRCVDIKRREHSKLRPHLAQAGEDLPEQVDETPGPQELADTEELGGYVRAAMGSLEPEAQALLDMRFVQGQPLGDIARELSISLEQTKYRLRRATVHLRSVLLHQYALEEA